MEKKTTQRIIGILVVIALVIILLPLLFGKNELVTQASAVKAPPFPDQQNQATAPDDTQQVAQAPTTDTAQPVVAADATPSAAVPATDAAAANNPAAKDVAVSNNADALNNPAKKDDTAPANNAAAKDQASANNAAAKDSAAANNSAAKDIAANSAAKDPSAPSATDSKDPAASVATSDAPKGKMPAPTKSVNEADAIKASKGGVDISPAVADELNGTGTAHPAASAPTPADAVSPTNSASNDQADHNNQLQASDSPAAARPDVEPKEQHSEKVSPDKSADLLKKADKSNQKHVRTASKEKIHATHSELAKLKTAAWVVQMGSFKDKANARHLADKLRAAGFKAFIHEVKSPKGERTRVWVGPESQQASAAKLSDQIEQQFKMRGILVNFKPLEL